VHGVAAVQMAVDVVHAAFGDGGAERLRELDAVAHRRAAVALEQLLRRGRYAVGTDQVEIGLETAVGDDYGRGAEIALAGFNRDPGLVGLQRGGAMPAQDAALTLLEIRAEPLQGDVGAVIFPSQPVALAPGRRQNVGLIAVEPDYINILALQPLHQPAA